MLTILQRIASRTIPLRQVCPIRCLTQAQPKAIVKVSAKSEHTTTTATARDHSFIFDEPKSLGGADKGPSPLEGLLAALAGCEAATTHMVAKRLGVKIDNLEFNIVGEYNPSAFRKMEKDAPSTHFHKVEVEVHYSSSESDERIKDLIHEVERLCPVSALLHAAKTEVISNWIRKG
eukprot:TRINITY_DN11552_c0_g1_i1.p1 TRINITY_DN11552_c0_g1~~TRINITY_DN11552_c0_g1_i1.p1  ORF type:complete len:176 (+),score=25.29 TRINITY_DN11552_c0_g1_i1:35-562(+)